MICIDDGDDESHWQDRVSSGFDRLVAFASIELTKSRRSIEDGAPSTSPDSGINQSSDGRTFLSSSSSSSQMDVPTNLLRTVVPIMKSSPPEVSESPPPSELPRTPSPSSPPTLFSRRSPLLIEAAADLHHGAFNHSSHHNPYGESSLKIPLKYQRQSKASSQKHFKKKFRERTWEYDDYDKDDVLSNNGSVDEYSGVGSHAGDGVDDPQLLSPTPASFNSTQYHKSSKFRPKGKDWDWRADHHRNKAQESDSAHA